MPRLGSRKSRNGCRQCKARRVKCDEQRPCSNCQKHGVNCSLLGSHTTIEPLDNSASSAPSIRSSSHPSPGTASSTALVPAATSSCGCSITTSWIEDLELMHHYTAHAHLTMPGNSQAKQTWGFLVTQEAFQHDYLLHCLLAFSASHLACIDPQSRSKYCMQASRHQAAAVAGLNRNLSGITPLNCHAMFAAASLMTINAFAESTNNTVEGLFEIFMLLRGMNIILSESQDLLWNGPFRLIFQPGKDQVTSLPPLLSSCIVRLRTLMDETQNCSPIAYTAAAQLLESLQFGIDTASHIAMRAVTFWPIKMDQDFIDAVREGRDEHIKSVMHQYLRILNLAGTEFWFMSSWRNVTL